MGGPVRPADNPRMHLTSPTFHRPHGGGRSIARGGGAGGPGWGAVRSGRHLQRAPALAMTAASWWTGVACTCEQTEAR